MSLRERFAEGELDILKCMVELNTNPKPSMLARNTIRCMEGGLWTVRFDDEDLVLTQVKEGLLHEVVRVSACVVLET